MSHTSTEDITREDGSKEMEKGGGGDGGHRGFMSGVCHTVNFRLIWQKKHV